MIDLNDMSKMALEISNKRIANGAHMTGDPLKHAAEELIEAVQAREKCFINYNNLQDVTLKEVEKDEKHYAEELADVITCILIAAADNNIDIEGALCMVERKNTRRAQMVGDKL